MLCPKNAISVSLTLVGNTPVTKSHSFPPLIVLTITPWSPTAKPCVEFLKTTLLRSLLNPGTHCGSMSQGEVVLVLFNFSIVPLVPTTNAVVVLMMWTPLNATPFELRLILVQVFPFSVK